MAIRLNITGDANQARTEIRSLNSVVEGAKEPLETAAKHTRGWTDSWAGFIDRINVVKGAINVFKGTVEALGKVWGWMDKQVDKIKELATEAGVAQLETQRFKFGVEAAGLSWDKVSESADVFIQKMMRTSRFSDEELQASLQMGIRLFQDYAVAEKMTATAADFAAATGKGFIQAQQDIRRALEQGGSSIKRYDASLAILIDTNRKMLPEQEAMRVNLTLLSERFGGAAQTELGNYTALLIQQKNAINNLRQTIGSLFLPILSTLTKNWTDFIFMLDAAVKKSEGFRRVGLIFEEVSKVLQGNSETNKKVIEVLVRIIDALGVAIEIVIRHILVIAEMFGLLSDKEKEAGKSGSVLNDTLDKIGDVAEIVIKIVEGGLTKAIDGLGAILITVRSRWEQFKAFLDVVGTSMKVTGLTIAKYLILGFEKILEILPKVMSAFGEFVEGASTLVDDPLMLEMAGKIKVAAGKIETYKEEIFGVSEADEARKKVESLQDAYDQYGKTIFELNEAMKFRQATGDESGAQEAAKKINDLLVIRLGIQDKLAEAERRSEDMSELPEQLKSVEESIERKKKQIEDFIKGVVAGKADIYDGDPHKGERLLLYLREMERRKKELEGMRGFDFEVDTSQANSINELSVAMNSLATATEKANLAEEALGIYADRLAGIKPIELKTEVKGLIESKIEIRPIQIEIRGDGPQTINSVTIAEDIAERIKNELIKDEGLVKYYSRTREEEIERINLIYNSLAEKIRISLMTGQE